MLTYRFSDTTPAFQETTAGTQRSYLTLQVLTREGTPVPQVAITLYAERGSKPVTERVLRTGVDGRTERIELNIPAKNYTLLDTNIEVPYLIFSIQLSVEGYYTETYRLMRIYADTVNMETLILTPLPLGATKAPQP